ncbi:ankyrin repeat-containing protein ITN1-like [Senna tora]|uniref:Ankyrin repeat-containing protein ITN1-like n=1 Tax=Senna tora TaxID=362788 RepID=A0A834XH95_9FABA|nr:ankyrin repeat-containing protein ITN1-like [Senna tora]
MELELGKKADGMAEISNSESDDVVVVVTKYKDKMEKPKRHALLKNWAAFKHFFQQDKAALLEPIDSSENTAIQVAARSNDPQLVIELLEMLQPTHRIFALRKGNAHKNTLLHQLIYCSNVNMVDALLQYHQKLTQTDAQAETEVPLLELTNELGETPVYRAAKYGRLDVLNHMATHVPLHHIHNHFPPKIHNTSILHVAIIGQYFEVAMWLISRVQGMDVLVNEKDENGLTCLQLLSQMPSVFRSFSQSRMNFAEWFIYSLLPEKGFEEYEGDGDSTSSSSSSSNFVTQNPDLDSGKDNVVKKPATSVLSRINYAIWRFFAREYEAINLIWKKKKQHKLAEQVAFFLVQKDKSWKTRTSNNAEPRKEAPLPVIYFPKSHNTSRKNKGTKKKQAMSKSEAPLLLAASTGIVEIVQRIIEVHPEAIAYVEDEQNVLHAAVKYRQRNIYRLIKRYGALNWLAAQISNTGQTVLHQVAGMEHYNAGNQAGVVFQLQDELRWFYRVKKAIPAPFVLHCNKDNLTARQVFEKEHKAMLLQAQDWIKGTAQSCSAVAVLVATVVFAAAYTVPGGTNEKGIPVFLGSPLFNFFTIMDVLALLSSLISVMMFLSILTSPFEMNDFYKSLPRKLALGFTLLFFSLTTTILAFSSSILLSLGLQKDGWTTSLIYSFTLFLVTLFGFTQFPMYMAVKYRMKKLFKTFNKFFHVG